MIKVALLFRWYVKVNSTEIAGHCRQTKMVRINLKSVRQLMQKVPKNFHDFLSSSSSSILFHLNLRSQTYK